MRIDESLFVSSIEMNVFMNNFRWHSLIIILLFNIHALNQHSQGYEYELL